MSVLVLSQSATNFPRRDVFGVVSTPPGLAPDFVNNDEFVLRSPQVDESGHTHAMAIEYKILKQHNLIVGFRKGQANSEDVPNAMKQIVDDPDFAWNMDRIFMVDEKADMSRLDLAGVHNIRNQVYRMCFGDRVPTPAELPIYRIAAVSPHPGNAAIMKLYRTAWETPQGPIIDMEVFDTIADALAWLGRKTVSEAEILQAFSGP